MSLLNPNRKILDRKLLQRGNSGCSSALRIYKSGSSKNYACKHIKTVPVKLFKLLPKLTKDTMLTIAAFQTIFLPVINHQ